MYNRISLLPPENNSTVNQWCSNTRIASTKSHTHKIPFNEPVPRLHPHCNLLPGDDTTSIPINMQKVTFPTQM